VRVFVALDIPEAVRVSLAEVRARLEKICRGGRWVRLQGVHITLKFIGEIPSERVERVRAALEHVPPRPPIESRFVGLGFFPNARRPRVFWAGIEAGESLAALATDIETQLAPLGIPNETRDFHPHLTLARLDAAEPAALDHLRAAANELAAAEFGQSSAREFYLYHSVLKSGGAEYTRLATYRLSPEPAS
jgi:2'-5' RNA ligase